MVTKAQHDRRYRCLPPLLREMREEAGLTQRDLGALLKKPQSWVYNCETANRRVDVTEFIVWCEACEVTPQVGLRRVLKLIQA